MYKWLTFNTILFLFGIWFGIILPFPYIHKAVIFAVIGLFFILFNWSFHGIFLEIRTIQNRKRKVKLAKIAKKIMPFHMYTGLTAFLFVTIHVVLIIESYGFQWRSTKMITGVIAFTVIIAQVTSGILRKLKATGKRRRFHLRNAFLLFFAIFIHILMGNF